MHLYPLVAASLVLASATTTASARDATETETLDLYQRVYPAGVDPYQEWHMDQTREGRDGHFPVPTFAPRCDGDDGAPHINIDDAGAASLGGWVADTAYVAPSVWLDPRAEVCDRAVVTGDVSVETSARIYGDANVHHGVRMLDGAYMDQHDFSVYIYGEAEVWGEVTLERYIGPVRIGDRALVASAPGRDEDGITLRGTFVRDDAKVTGVNIEAEGGQVYGLARVSDDSFIGIAAQVYGRAYVRGGTIDVRAHVRDDAFVGARVTVTDDARIVGSAALESWTFGTVRVAGHAVVGDDAQVRPWGGPLVIDRNAIVSGDAEVTGHVLITDQATVGAGAEVMDNATVTGDASVTDAVVRHNAFVGGSALLSGAAAGTVVVENDARVDDVASILDQAIISNNAQVYGSASIRGAARVAKHARVYEDAIVQDDAVVTDSAHIRGNTVVGGSYVVGGSTVLFTGTYE